MLKDLLKEKTYILGGVPPKIHTNYPSRYALGEKVIFNPTPNTKVPAIITGVRFSTAKVIYNLQCLHGDEIGAYVRNVYSHRVIDYKEDVFEGVSEEIIQDILDLLRRNLIEQLLSSNNIRDVLSEAKDKECRTL